jgi:hypothetical protein
MTAGRAVVFACTLAAFLTLAAPLAAQRPPAGRRGFDRVELEERIRAQMGRLIRERLALDSATAAELSVAMRDFEDRRRALASEEREARRRAEALMRREAAVADSVAARDQEALGVLRQMADLRQREIALAREEQERLLEILTATQVLELQALRAQLGRRIMMLRGDREGPGDFRRRRRGPGGER